MRPVVHANRHRVSLSIHGGVLQTHLAKVLKRKRLVKVIIKFLKNAHGKIACKILCGYDVRPIVVLDHDCEFRLQVCPDKIINFNRHIGVLQLKDLFYFFHIRLFNAGSSWIENA